MFNYYPTYFSQACVQDDTAISGYHCGETVSFTTTTFPPSPFYNSVVDGNVVCTPEYVRCAPTCFKCFGRDIIQYCHHQTLFVSLSRH